MSIWDSIKRNSPPLTVWYNFFMWLGWWITLFIVGLGMLAVIIKSLF